MNPSGSQARHPAPPPSRPLVTSLNHANSSQAHAALVAADRNETSFEHITKSLRGPYDEQTVRELMKSLQDANIAKSHFYMVSGFAELYSERSKLVKHVKQSADRQYTRAGLQALSEETDELLCFVTGSDANDLEEGETEENSSDPYVYKDNRRLARMHTFLTDEHRSICHRLLYGPELVVEAALKHKSNPDEEKPYYNCYADLAKHAETEGSCIDLELVACLGFRLFSKWPELDSRALRRVNPPAERSGMARGMREKKARILEDKNLLAHNGTIHQHTHFVSSRNVPDGSKESELIFKYYYVASGALSEFSTSISAVTSAWLYPVMAVANTIADRVSHSHETKFPRRMQSDYYDKEANIMTHLVSPSEIIDAFFLTTAKIKFARFDSLGQEETIEFIYDFFKCLFGVLEIPTWFSWPFSIANKMMYHHMIRSGHNFGIANLNGIWEEYGWQKLGAEDHEKMMEDLLQMLIDSHLVSLARVRKPSFSRLSQPSFSAELAQLNLGKSQNPATASATPALYPHNQAPEVYDRKYLHP